MAGSGGSDGKVEASLGPAVPLLINLLPTKLSFATGVKLISNTQKLNAQLVCVSVGMMFWIVKTSKLGNNLPEIPIFFHMPNLKKLQTECMMFSGLLEG